MTFSSQTESYDDLWDDDFIHGLADHCPLLQSLSLKARVFCPDVWDLQLLGHVLPGLRCLDINLVAPSGDLGSLPHLSFPNLHTIRYGSPRERLPYDCALMKVLLRPGTHLPSLRRIALESMAPSLPTQPVMPSLFSKLTYLTLLSSDTWFLPQNSLLLHCPNLTRLHVAYDGAFPLRAPSWTSHVSSFQSPDNQLKVLSFSCNHLPDPPDPYPVLTWFILNLARSDPPRLELILVDTASFGLSACSPLFTTFWHNAFLPHSIPIETTQYSLSIVHRPNTISQ